LLIAITISSASLIYSAIHGAAKAKRSIGNAETTLINHNNKLRWLDAKRSQIEKDYEDKVSDWQITQRREIELQNLTHQSRLDAIARNNEVAAAIHDQRKQVVEAQGQLIRRQHDRVIAANGQAQELTSDAVAARESRNKEFEHFRREPDYQALLQCIAAIDICTAEIQDRKELMTNETIRRGYLRTNAEYLA
jgi:hypothetical protein